MVQWKNNSNTFIEVEWWGARNEPRIELLEGSFVHGFQASEKRHGDMNYMDFYTGGEHLTNDISDSPWQVPDIPYDAFCVTIQ